MDFNIFSETPDEGEAMLSLTEAVRYLGTFRPALYRLIALRQLPAYRMLGRRRAIYLKKRDLDAIRLQLA
ncbi:MAG: helix-turn-helix domain-containing protein [Chloroflexota bacterium]